MAEVKYNIGDKVRTKIHYMNDKRTEVDAVIRGINLDDTDTIKYKIHFDPDDFHKKQGSTGCEGYVDQNDILELKECEIKEYWISAIVQNDGDDQAWLLSLTDSVSSIEDAMKKIEFMRKSHRVLSVWIDSYDNENNKHIIFHECYVNIMGDVKKREGDIW